jgi:signal peptidase I
MKEFLKDVVVALIIVLAITFVIKPTIVKESSMEPTLYSDNYLFVNKLAYVNKDHPEYEDIIVFQSDISKDDGNGKKMLIKRVVGVENDTITITDGVVYRNGVALEEPYTLEGYTTGEVYNLVVPQNEVFVMGDNRSISLDSRDSEVGTITEESILGKAFVRLFPFRDMGLL